MPIALVTGASRGLGLALTRALAQKGWSLVITARNATELEAARAELAVRTHVIAVPGDITDEAHASRLVDAARPLGHLDALVNNASTLGPSPRPNLLDYPLDDLRRVYDVNVLAALRLTQLAAPLLHDGARVVNISSDAGVDAYPGWGGYGSSKAALEHLTRVLATERPEWRVYSVDPGDMNTRMQQEAFPGEDISDRPDPEVSVPGLLRLLNGDLPGGRYVARDLAQVTA